MQNVFRSYISTIFGFGLMGLSVYAWWENDDWYQIGLPFIAGLVLVFVQDKISDYVTSLFNILLDKIKPKP